jgi:Protein of unknown function (DUF3768)
VRIAALNDQARHNFFFFSDFYETAGFGALSIDDRQAARLAIAQYDAFDSETGPFGEHDHGVIFRLADGTWVSGAESRSAAVIVVCWRFDYFDHNRKRPSRAPWDSAVTRRKLTIGLEDELMR